MADKAEKAASTVRRDTLLAIEHAAQDRWAVERPYETNVIPGKEKFFITFPYPYMNGRLHLGHGFSFSKSEFAARFWRLKGRNVLLPFGLHVTGTPIAACAQKLANEMAKYGCPPQFPPEVLEPQKKEDEKPAEVEVGATAKFTGRRAKVGPAKPQWLIMQSMGIPDSEIPKFADPRHWLDYFPPLALEDGKKLGCHIDYRRSFITTDVNPFYDSFVRWQFEHLQRKNLLGFGKRHCVYSPLDGQPCADHDRQSGEGVAPQEYTVVKLRVHQPAEFEGLAEFAAHFEGSDVVLPGATLRPETVVGQTNVWISPNIIYQAFTVQFPGSDKSEVWLTTTKAARNLAYQDVVVNGKSNHDPTPLFEVAGERLIGMPMKAPHCPFDKIYTLPMATISEAKGTAVVMSVPSDSPDDWINHQSLYNKPEYRAKLNLKDEWILPFKPVPILTVGGEIGENSAEFMCKKLKIGGPKDAALLEEAKKECYQAGFYSGVMTIGPFKGEKVSDAKTKMADLMLASGDAVKYQEPQKEVISRSGDVCVVALCDQWYLEYGTKDWKATVKEHVTTELETYFPGIKNAFDEALNFLSSWPCSRNFGLGTALPSREGDLTKVIIDSLSDSTIYMAYYTVARMLHEAADGSLNLDGTRPNKYGIKPEMMSSAAWDFILLNKGTAEEVEAKTGLPRNLSEEMRGEFNYFYPVDLRVSGKDLIQNHLTMFLYNHTAIWEDKSKWPRSIYCNGHILIDGKKMSKSAGNFVTLSDAVDTYTADGARMAFADAGDSLDDANFVTEIASGMILKLTTFIDFLKNRKAALDTFRAGDRNLFDAIMENALNNAIIKADGFYANMAFRQVLSTVFFELQADQVQYELQCADLGPHRDVMARYLDAIVVMMMPIIPHTAEHLWGNVLGHSDSVMQQTFPQPSARVDIGMQFASKLIQDVAHDIRTQVAKAKKRGPVDTVIVYVNSAYADWQVKGLQALNAIPRDDNGEFPKDTLKMITSRKESWMDPKMMQDVMAFIAFAKGNAEKYGPDALSPKPPCNDSQVLQDAKPFLIGNTGVPNIVIHDASDASAEAPHAVAKGKARPGQPQVAILNADVKK
jgi:leucyl-tRNA synthetase